MIRNYIEQPFIVIGMHRSGTTMVAEAMNNSGICMGVMRDHNSEAFHFLSLNQQMLWAAGADWIEPKIPGKENDLTLPAYSIYAEHIKSESANPLKLKLLHNNPWGWKDPRNTFTIKYWLQVFPKAKVLHVLRDGRAVAMSLKNRNNVKGEVYDERLNDLEFNFKLWEKYISEGLKWQSLGKNYLMIKYEDLVSNQSAVLNLLDKFTMKQVSHFMQPKLKSRSNFPDELNQLAQTSALFNELGYQV